MMNETNMLSQTTEYALRAMLYLSRDRGRTFRPSRSIAEALQAPPRYLSKTLGRLVAAGMLESTRGPGGGVRLARPAERISLADVINVFEEDSRVRSCLLSAECCIEPGPCESHGLWCRLQEQALGPFQQTTLEELARGTTREEGSRTA
jgi:Rrf2 family transcriptional regulator, iron-sulfur cluster assembly transcription factor